MRIGECGQPQAPGDGSASGIAEQPTDLASPPTTGPDSGAQRPSALGIWAFVLAILGVVGLLPIVGSVLGLVLGRVAVRQSVQRRVVGGRGLAQSAVIVSVVTLPAAVMLAAANVAAESAG